MVDVKTCPVCKGEIPADAAACMHCGRTVRAYHPNGQRKNPWWIYAVGVLIVAVLIVSLLASLSY